ncbi:MAG: hypothetical protein WCJ03_10400 [Bacteroidales bacterium]
MEYPINDITLADYDMSKYIYRILLTQPTILMSWGFHSPIVIKQGLKFSVNGFILKGQVQIIYNEGSDLFDLTFFTEVNEVRNTLTGVYIDELVDTIDRHVERVNNYNARVNQEYGFENNNDQTI